MAEIHAIVNGNWNAASIWDSNSIPTRDDIVYIDNHTITWSGNIAECKELHFSGTGYISGSFQCIGDIILEQGLSATHAVMRTTSSYYHNGTVIDGNIYLYSGVLLNNGELICNGNIYVYSNSIVMSNYDGASYGWFTCNGNIEIHDAGVLKMGGSTHRYVTINGILKIFEDYFLDTPTFNWVSQSYTFFAAKIINLTSVPFANNIGQSGTQSDLVMQINEIYSPNSTLISEYLPNNRSLQIGKAVLKNISPGTSVSWVIDDLTFTDDNNLLFGNIQITDVHCNPNAHLHIYTSEQTTDLQPQESNVKDGIVYDGGNRTGTYLPNFPQESTVLKDVEYGDDKVGTLEVIALSGATATADNISVVNLTEQQLQRVGNSATVSTVQKCFEDFKE